MSNFEPIELGDRVKDPITGYAGIVIAITTWLNGCVRMAVQPETLDKDGKPQDDRYFDQSQLRVVDKRVHTPVVLAVAEALPPVIKRRSNGGPAREQGNFRGPTGTAR